jgi:transmembrane sensor
MDHHKTDNDQLIASFLSGNITPSEREELQQWQNLSAENKKAFDDSVKVWANCPQQLTQSQIEQDMLLIQRRIIAQSALQLKHDRVIMRFLRVAAILIGPVMLAVGWYIGNADFSTKEVAWNTVTAPKKHVAACTLADGTEVWLNAGSTLSYPSIDPSDKREVKLTGEGYFKVTKNAKKPFFVITKQATVKVLGTMFNMKAYPAEAQIVTTLEDGSVEFFAQNSGTAPLRLRPGEQAVYNTSNGKTEINIVDASRFSAWRSDKFIFKDADLKTIITELERLYDIKIYIKNPRLEKLRFRGMFSYDQDLLDAFETLRRSVKLNYTIKGREVWLE